MADGLSGRLPQQVAADRVALRHAVRRQIFCPVSGHVLDIDDAVLIQLSHADGTPSSASVYTGAVWDSGGDQVAAMAARHQQRLTVVDGRVLSGTAAVRAAPPGAPQFTVRAQDLAAALRHLLRIGDTADRLTLSAVADGAAEVAVARPYGKRTLVQAVSTVPAAVETPGRAVLALTGVRAALKADPVAPLVVDAVAGHAVIGRTVLPLLPVVPVPDGHDPAAALRVSVRDFARAAATADRLTDPADTGLLVRNVWIALHPGRLEVTGTDRFRLAQTALPAVRLPYADLARPVLADVPGAVAVAAAKMARRGGLDIGADHTLLVLSAGTHRIRIWHGSTSHPDTDALFPATADRFAVRAGDLADAWAAATGQARRFDTDATAARYADRTVTERPRATIRVRIGGGRIGFTVEAPQLRVATGTPPPRPDDVHTGDIAADGPADTEWEFALMPAALDAVLHAADPDATLVLARPAGSAVRRLLMFAPGERHAISHARTRTEQAAEQTRVMAGQAAANQAARAARPARLDA